MQAAQENVEATPKMSSIQPTGAMFFYFGTENGPESALLLQHTNIIINAREVEQKWKKIILNLKIELNTLMTLQ